MKFLNSQLAAMDTSIIVGSNVLMLMTFAFSLLGFVAGSLLFPDDRSNDPQPATGKGANQ
ncbi:MAG: hypothetical protein HQ518_27915 [Rhodopirellula sp.]|nr:hypothetical protein [Rhodopirellula sp.]